MYITRYACYLSIEATPGPGDERRFTAADLRLLALIYQQTRAGKRHEQVAAQLEAGALDEFDRQPPEDAQEGPQAPQSEPGAPFLLVPIAALRAGMALWQDAVRREQEALERERELQARLDELRQELGCKEGELAALRRNGANRPGGGPRRLVAGKHRAGGAKGGA